MTEPKPYTLADLLRDLEDVRAGLDLATKYHAKVQGVPVAGRRSNSSLSASGT